MHILFSSICFIEDAYNKSLNITSIDIGFSVKMDTIVGINLYLQLYFAITKMLKTEIILVLYI